MRGLGLALAVGAVSLAGCQGHEPAAGASNGSENAASLATNTSGPSGTSLNEQSALRSTDPEIAAKGYALPASGTLSGIDLANWAKLKRDATGGDQFHDGFNDGPIAGRSFQIQFDVNKGGLGQPSFFYDKDTGVLGLDVNMTSGGSARGAMLVLESKESMGDPKVMSNAFGASADVKPMTERLIGVGAYDSLPGIFTLDVGEGPYQNFKQLEYRVKLSGDDAQRLTSHMRAVIDGTVAKNRKGHTVECDYGKEQAKLDDPYERETYSCIVVAKFKRIAFLTGDGSVVKEWTAK